MSNEKEDLCAMVLTNGLKSCLECGKWDGGEGIMRYVLLTML